MKKALLTLCVLTVVLGVPASAGQPASCDIQGTWVGTVDPAAGGGRFLSSYEGRTRISGTTDLQFFDLPADPFGADSLTDVKGVWERTGSRAYSFSMISFGLDVTGAPIYRVVNSGTKTLSADCAVMTIVSNVQYFTPDGDPITGCFGPFVSTADRLEITSSCEP